MRVGAAAEIKPDERRVALPPATRPFVLELADAGHVTARLETGCNVAAGRITHPGVAAAFSDLPASIAGATA